MLVAADAQAPRSPQGFPGAAPPGAPALIRRLEAEPAAIDPGQPVTLHWEVLNAYAVSIAPDPGKVALRGTQRVAPASTTTYTLTATGSGGEVTRAVTVTVRGTSASPAPVAAKNEPSPVPKLANGKPDLSGLYMAEKGVRLVGARATGARRREISRRDAPRRPRHRHPMSSARRARRRDAAVPASDRAHAADLRRHV